MDYKNKLISKKRKAFTLIELLIVIAIIGILFVVLISKVDFATDKAKATGVQTDFRSFQVAIESVARENAGFATFGWDTGDTNGDRIRNSYDKGDTNKNGKQDPGEVFIGSKTYGETWTGIYTLTNPADATDKSAIAALEEAINKNLDPKLHITIHDDLTITMANGAKDPWDTEYHGYYITNATVDKKDRGAIVMYSNGANQEFGSEHSISNGIVTVNVPGNNVYGKDDYSIAVVYTYLNGYGEVKNMTTGFSNNQMLSDGLISNNNSNSNSLQQITDFGMMYDVVYTDLEQTIGLILHKDNSMYIFEYFDDELKLFASFDYIDEPLVLLDTTSIDDDCFLLTTNHDNNIHLSFNKNINSIDLEIRGTRYVLNNHMNLPINFTQTQSLFIPIFIEGDECELISIKQNNILIDNKTICTHYDNKEAFLCIECEIMISKSCFNNILIETNQLIGLFTYYDGHEHQREYVGIANVHEKCTICGYKYNNHIISTTNIIENNQSKIKHTCGCGYFYYDSLNNYSWNELQAIAQFSLSEQELQEFYNINLGDYKTYESTNYYLVEAYGDYGGFVFLYDTGLRECMTNGSFATGGTANVSGGYAASDLCVKVNELYNNLNDPHLKSAIKEVTIECNDYKYNENIYNYNCHIFVPSAYELGYKSSYCNRMGNAFTYFWTIDQPGRKQFFRNISVPIWTRTVSDSYVTTFYKVENDSLGSYDAGNALHVLAAFVIG